MRQILLATLVLASMPAGRAVAGPAATATCGGLAVTILGTPEDDVIVGTPAADVIHGRGGRDDIRGLAGNDIICGGAGRDVLRGGPGDDVLFGGSAVDEVRGGGGYDVLWGGIGGDVLRGGAADDVIFGGSGQDDLRGGYGADVCFGGPGNDNGTSCNEPATADPTRLQAGESLLVGQSISSPDGRFTLRMAADGNVALGDGTRQYWDTDTEGSSGARLTMGSTGDLFVSYRGAVMWQTGSEAAGAFAKLGNDANLTVLNGDAAVIWDRRSHPGTPDWQLPWPLGESWDAGSPHGPNNGSLDFGPTDGVGDVVAIASGTVGWFECQSGGRYLQVEHGGGWMSTYYHLAEINTELIGKWIEVGTPLGRAARAVPCGGSSTFPHVHLVIWRNGERQTADALSIGGYTAHAGSQLYWGDWTENATGTTVVVNRGGAVCCLNNAGPA